MIYELNIPDTPPSFNKVGHSGSRWVWTATKKAWQETIEVALMQSGVPRRRDYIEATAFLRFPTRRSRDAGNYRTLLEKCLGDALVNGAWLVNDTPDEFRFGDVIFEEELGPHRTRILLEVQ